MDVYTKLPLDVKLMAGLMTLMGLWAMALLAVLYPPNSDVWPMSLRLAGIGISLPYLTLAYLLTRRLPSARALTLIVSFVATAGSLVNVLQIPSGFGLIQDVNEHAGQVVVNP